MPRSQALLATLLPLALVLGAMGTASAPAEVPAVLESPDAGAPLEAPADAGTGLVGLLPPTSVPSREKAPPITQLKALARKDDVLAQARLSGGRLVLPAAKGGATLTVDPALQAQITRIMQDYQVPYGAAVVMEPSTGRVLALAEHSQTDPSMRGLTTRAVFPAASIFKIVTGSALLEAGVSPTEESCFHGGKRGLSEKLLEDSSRDGACHTLSSAMGKSANVVFAKLTRKYLSADALRRMAARLRFNRPMAFPIPTDVSLASIPEDEFGLANAGAGFGDVYLSPLHGAALAAASATGVWRDPVLFEPSPEAAAAASAEQVLSPEVQRALAGMLEETVTRGTARRVFRERGFRVEGAVGKTGTLADKNPFRDYSWFVGFAPKDHPRVAVAAVIVNEPLWRIRATWLGREAMRLALERFPAPEVAPEAPRVAQPALPVAPEPGGEAVSTASAADAQAPGPAAQEEPPADADEEALPAAAANASAPIP
jgi:penicillin-binding protein A